MDKAFIFEDYNTDVIIKFIKSPLELFFYSSLNDCELPKNVHILKPKINYKNETLTFPKGLTLSDIFYEQKEKLISSILTTLLFLEENGIIYGDLKLSNIIFYENEFYLIDFDQIIFYKLPNMEQFQSQTYNFDDEKERKTKNELKENGEEKCKSFETKSKRKENGEEKCKIFENERNQKENGEDECECFENERKNTNECNCHIYFTDHKRNLMKAFAILIFFLCTNDKTRLMVEKWFQNKNYKFVKSFFSSSIWKKSIKNENEQWVTYIEALLNVYSFKEFFVYLSIINSSSTDVGDAITQKISSSKAVTQKTSPSTAGSSITSFSVASLSVTGSAGSSITSFSVASSPSSSVASSSTASGFAPFDLPLPIATLEYREMLLFHKTPLYKRYDFTFNIDKLCKIEYEAWFCYETLYNETIFFISVEFYRCYRSSIYFYYNLDKTSDALFFAACLKFCHMLLNIHINYSAIVTHNDQIIMEQLIEMVENKIYNYLNFKIPSLFTNGIEDITCSLPENL
jgi:hypothetical protein